MDVRIKNIPTFSLENASISLFFCWVYVVYYF